MSTTNADGRRVGDACEYLIGAFARGTLVILYLTVIEIGAAVYVGSLLFEVHFAQFAGEATIAHAEIVIQHTDAAVQTLTLVHC